MRSRILAGPLAAALAVAVLASGCTGKNAVDQTAGGQFRYVSSSALGKTWAPADRKPASDFTADLLSGDGTYSLRSDAGKVVVINFWASWCNPCKVETPQFDSVYRAYKAKGVDFVGIDFKDGKADARHFVATNDISYPIVYDQQGKTALKLGNLPALGLPFTVVIDKRQRVAAVYTQQVAPNDLKPVLNRLLDESGAPAGALAARSSGAGA